MGDYKILSDSTTDLPVEIIDTLDIDILPLQFLIDSKNYRDYPDGRDIDGKTFYRLLREGKNVTTVQVNVETFLTSFESYLCKGMDLLYLSFSSGLSGTFNSAMVAAKELSKKYPDRKIVVVDTLAASMGEGLLVYHAAMKKKQGLSIEEVASWVESNKNHLCHWFTVADLFHLKRGGRISPATAVVGTMLGIKPVLHVDNEGHLIPVHKVRGRKASLDSLCQQMKETCIRPESQMIFISHGDCENDARYLADQIKKEMGVKEIVLNLIGPVIGAHSGPGTVALFFLGKEK